MDGGGGGGPAPFLIKTYEMVDDSSTDAIVSWSSSRKSFVVWNPPEFQRLLLPTYFKHNNFSSFIRQLNTYGFRKVDPERWEFANEDFMKDQKHLLKNIHRRKPIHSHSHPQGSFDPERSAFEEEIDRLSREKTLLEGNVSGFKDKQSAAKAQLDTLKHRIVSMEQKQERLLSFLEKAVRNPNFVERLGHKLDTTDFSAYNKKRRLPQADSVLLDSQSDLCSDKLRLELSSPAVSDVNLLSRSTQSSNEDGVISPNDGWSNDVVVRTAGLELSDTGASFTLKMDSSLSCKCKVGTESPKLNSFHLSLNDEGAGDDHLSCLLDLTLASSSLHLDKGQKTVGAGMDLSSHENENNSNNTIVGHKAPTKDRTVSEDDLHNKKKQGAVATGRARVNDLFWEQFLTERPGCSDNEESSAGGKKGMD